MSYIQFPMKVSAEDVLQDAITSIQDKFSNWKPIPGELDVALLQAWATEAAELRSLASEVPTSIFRWFGAVLVGLPPIDATPAIAVTTWTMINTDGYTIPVGTQVSIPGPDAEQIAFETVAATTVPPGSTVATNVSVVAITPGQIGSGLGSPGGTVTLEDPLVFVQTITQVAATTGGSDAEDDATYLGRLAEDLSMLSPRLILPRDYAIDAKNVPGVWRAIAADGYNPFHNILTLNEASFETSVANWTSYANATIAQTTAQAADGTNSMSLTSVAAGDMGAVLSGSTGPKAVTPGDVITALASFRSAVSARSVKVGIGWYDVSNVIIGTTVFGSTVADTTTGWVQASVTATAPPLATKARITVVVLATGGASEVHYVDKLSLRRGSTTDWVAGGTPETGNARMVTVAVVDSLGNDLDTSTKNTLKARQEALRELGFIVNVMGPITTAIDVTFNVQTVPGFDTTDVAARSEVAVAAFLNKAVWGQDPASLGDQQSARTWVVNNVVRFQELSTILNNVTGVDHWTTLQIGRAGSTMGSADIPLAGVAPLANAGTIIGSAT